MKSPILVTGIHRSGTTFVGKMLASAPGVGYVQEPFNPDLGIQGVDVWYKYIRAGMENEEYWAGIVQNLLQGKARYKNRPGTHGGFLRTAGRRFFGSRDYLQYLKSSRFPGSRRLLLKDPLAALSSGWLHDRFGMKVVALLRHPAGFAASAARLGWDYNFFQFLTSQKFLMDDYLQEILEPYDLQALSQPEGAALLWRCVYTILENYNSKCSVFRLVRLEDVSASPQEEFRELFNFLGLEFTVTAEKLIRESTSAENPVSAPDGKVHSLRRNSRGIASSWQKLYNNSEIHRIMELAGSLADKYYPN